MEFKEIINSLYPISDEAVDLMQSYVHTVSLKRKELLIEQGKINANLYMIKSGSCRAFSLDDGREFSRYFVFEGNCFASMHSYHKSLPSVYSVEAMVPTEPYYLRGTEMKALVRNNSEISAWANYLCVESLFSLERRFQYLGVGDAYSRYKLFFTTRPLQSLMQVPLKHLASYLNITPQTLSKFRHRHALEGSKRSRE